MSVITKGKTFANGEQLTAGKLNQMLDAAVFSSAAVDNTKTTLSGGAITIAPGGISFTELANALVNDTDTMTDASATTLATSESIKAYIDAEINKTLGFNQTWQAVTRVIDDSTEYTNDTGKPITVRLYAAYVNVGASDDISVDIALKTGGGSFGYVKLIDSIGFDGYSSDIGQIVIPPDFTYKFRSNNSTTLSAADFHELR